MYPHRLHLHFSDWLKNFRNFRNCCFLVFIYVSVIFPDHYSGFTDIRKDVPHLTHRNIGNSLAQPQDFYAAVNLLVKQREVAAFRHEVGVNGFQNELTRSLCLSFIEEVQSCEPEGAEWDAEVSLSSPHCSWLLRREDEEFPPVSASLRAAGWWLHCPSTPPETPCVLVKDPELLFCVFSLAPVTLTGFALLGTFGSVRTSQTCSNWTSLFSWLAISDILMSLMMCHLKNMGRRLRIDRCEEQWSIAGLPGSCFFVFVF